MKAPHPLLVATLAACLGGHAVSFAQDDPKKPAPTEAKTDEEKPAPAPAKPAADAAAEAVSDKKAREILVKAAERQSAGDLAEPGKLESFHVVFFKARLQRERKSEKGETVTEEFETDTRGLVVDWMKGSIKTQITVDENTTTKARYLPMDTAWISDGTTVSNLTGDRKTDFDQLEFHRRVIDQLLDVAILGKLVADKALWAVIDDSTAPNAVAIRRAPGADGADVVRLTLWIEKTADGGFGDVVQASMPPTEEGGATLVYKFGYHDKFPTVTRKDAETKMRFPYSVEVEERRPGEEKPRPMLKLKTDSVSINTVVEADFYQPKPKPKPPK